MFDIDFSRSALSFIAALIFTSTAVGAAIGPARMAETAAVVYADPAPTAEGAVHA